VSDYSRMIVQ